MPTGLDEVHAHQYTMQRVASALTRHDPDPHGARPPRTLMLTLIGALVAAIVAVGYLVINQITGQGTPRDLRATASSVLIEKETGAQFVYTKADDRLHPVINYASGLLLAEGAGQTPITVRRNRLTALMRDSGVQLGATLGIPDAPDALPRPADLIREPWQVCTGTGTGEAAPRSEMMIGNRAVSGGHALAVAEGRSPGESLLLRSTDRQSFLVYGHRKLRIADPAVMLAAFGWVGRPQQPVAAAWLNTLPSGPDIATPVVEGLGERSGVVDARVGQLYRAPGPAGDQWAVVRRDDVQPISEVQARLLQADPQTRVGSPLSVDTSEFARLPLPATAPADSAAQLPTTVPTLVSIVTKACARIPDASAGVTAILVDPTTTAPAAAPPRPATGPVADGRAGIDRIGVPFGRGVLVRSAASPTAPPGTGALSIVTDGGIRYPIADRESLGRIGYANATPHAMPSNLVSLLPTGPALSIATAGRTP